MITLVQAQSISNTVFSIIGAIVILIISFYHILSTSNHHKQSEDIYPLSLRISIVFIINAIYTQFTLTIRISSINSIFCTYINYTGAPSYVTYKLLMYLILTTRAEEYFNNSAFAYSAKKLRIWKLILITWCALNIIGFMATTSTMIYDEDRVPKCVDIVVPVIGILFVLLDLVAGIGCGYLLINPLLKMHKMEKQSIKDQIDSDNDNEKHHNKTTELQRNRSMSTQNQINIQGTFKRVARKQAILSGIAILPTWLNLVAIIILTEMYMVFISIDLVISTLSVLLIYSWNQWLYDRLCCCCSYKEMQSVAEESVMNLGVVIGQTDTKEVCASTTEGNPDKQNTAVIH